MKFPRHKMDIESKNQFLQQLHQKRIGFSPFVFCEFFQGMDVLQIYGHNSGEYFFGIYDSAGNYIGHVYFGSKFNQEAVAKICNICMPKKYYDVWEYVKNHSDVSYYKFDKSQYAFVLESVLKKV